MDDVSILAAPPAVEITEGAIVRRRRARRVILGEVRLILRHAQRAVVAWQGVLSHQLSTSEILLRDLVLVVPAVEPLAEVPRLLCKLAQGQGFALHLLRDPDAGLRQVLRERLPTALAALQRRALTLVWLDAYAHKAAAARGPLQREELRESVLRPLLEAPPDRTGEGWLWCLDLVGAESGDGLIWLLGRLEDKREVLRLTLGCPLLVLLTGAQALKVERHAPALLAPSLAHPSGAGPR